MAVFVLLGAVIRNVNLLIILAGALVGLMLIQWRVCAKTLYGLTTHRRLPRSITARKPFDIELSISNPKSWLGAWLVLAHDRIVASSQHEGGKNVSQGIRLLFSSVPPQSRRTQKYRCVVQRRGKYEFLGTELNTRFPMGLLRGISPGRASDESFIVQPTIGRLLPTWTELFGVRTSNARLKRTKSLSDEGEFFGLRGYRPGDSPRWIHWRSSARRDELVVKQFQNEDSREWVILLDLFEDRHRGSASNNDTLSAEDLAVEFAATLVNYVAGTQTGVITVAIADSQPVLASRVQSRSHASGVLDRLAVASSCSGSQIFDTLRMLELEHRRVESLVVISTRPKINLTLSTELGNAVVFWHTLHWLDVASGDLKKYFVPGDNVD
jgi:uncharacterized protein (DUF58 family)